MKNKEVAVQHLSIEKNTILKKHVDSVAEHIIVVDGEIFQDIDGSITNAKKNGYLFVAPNKPHLLYSHESAKVICISVPASEGYPNGR